MVQISEIRANNRSFASEKHTGKVAVFVGGTAGIGKATLNALATLLDRPHFYVVGRSSPEHFETQRSDLLKLNPSATVTFIRAEISLLSGVDDACTQILSSAPKIDYLCMSAGYLPLAGAVKTSENLELCYQLSYISRIRFVHLLLPSLLRSDNPRVLSILGGSKEGPLVEPDLGLESNWTLTNLVNQASTLTTLIFGRFAEGNPEKLTLIHSAPGLVKTEIAGKLKANDDSGILWKLFFPVLRQATAWFIAYKGISAEESGERNAELLVSGRFTPGKVWRVDPEGEVAPPSEMLDDYKEEGWVEQGWEFTTGVWKRVLGDKA